MRMGESLETLDREGESSDTPQGVRQFEQLNTKRISDTRPGLKIRLRRVDADTDEWQSELPRRIDRTADIAGSPPFQLISLVQGA